MKTINITRFLFLLIGLNTYSCNYKKSKISITPLPNLTFLDTSIKKDYRIDRFLITNFIDNETSKAVLDSICLKTNTEYKKVYRNYQMVLYKTSQITNKANIAKNPRVIDRYSQDHDMIYQYEWEHGEFIIRYKYKGGKIIEPRNSDEIEVLETKK